MIVIDKALQANPTDENLIIEQRDLKHQLDILYMDNAIGAHIRSKVKWIEDGERSTSYFLAVEKHRQGRNVIKSLKPNIY